MDQSAFFNAVLVRYPDLLDTYLTAGGLCHPADNFGAVFAVAEHVGAAGSDFLLALAVAYEIQCRFSAQVPGLDVEGHLAGHRRDAGAVYATMLARRGITGPRGISKNRMVWSSYSTRRSTCARTTARLTAVEQTYLKQYCALIHGQVLIDATLALRDEHAIAAADLTEAYPERTAARVRITLDNGRELGREQADFEGSPTRPMSWDLVEEKFHWLAEPFADAVLRGEIVDSVSRLDDIAVADLAALLGAISPSAQRPRIRGRL